MSKILTIILLFGLRALGQTITGAEIDSTGYFIKLWTTGLYTNGTHNLGWNTNRSVSGTERLILDFTSVEPIGPGTTARRVYGTEALRIPGVGFKDEEVYAGGVILKYALSEDICAGDASLTLTTVNGLYAQGGSNLNAVTSMTVTNSSAQTYPKTIGNWTWPGFTHIQSSTVTQRFHAYHPSAQLGRPVQGVYFSATDGTNSTGTWVYKPTVDTSWGDAEPVPEYIGVLDLSAFPQPNFITFNAVAFPWWGDTNAVLDTAKSVYSFPHPAPVPITNLVDSAGTYPVVRAIVATNGVNASGVAANPTYWATNQSPPAFLNIGAAFTAIAATNNAQFSHNDITGGIVLLNEGGHTWMGSACTITAGPRIFAVIKPNTGAARENTVLTTQATDTRCTNDRDLFLFENLTFDTSGAFFVQENVWMDLCMVLNATSSSFNQASTAQLVWYVTRSTVSNLTQGLRSFSTQRVAPGIVRGNRFVGSIPTIHGINMIGNIKTVGGSDQLKILSGFAGGLTPKFGQIVAYNKIYNTRSLGNILDFGGDSNIVDGFVLANNLVEQTTNDTASAAFNLFSDSSRDFTNAMVWNNTMVGTKNFLFYNDSGSTARYRVQCTVLNNIFDDLNMKGDLFNPTNAARIGNWSTIFGCGMYGNASLETTNVGAFGAFLPEFAGVSSWAGDGTYTTNYPVFYERLAHDGVGTLPGGGDYRLHSRSPLMQRNAAESYRRRKWVLSHDGNGVVRTEVDPPGVYGDGQVRKGFTE